ncbi:MAG TPA: glycoside-pentoside-hexuronide (GPH):cation symporter [Propioniciclava tarda]|nr:glycoside-pentoside-hexuronide (GPH):cation symporter [Propioniciclava tarda]
MTATPSVLRNRWSFAIGTIGRDMVYGLVSMFLIVFITDAVHVSNWTLGLLMGLILAVRLLDAVGDFAIGALVDNTRTRWGPYKPWIAIGMLVSASATVLLFTDFGLREGAFVLAFTLLYIVWSFSFSANDIPYWSFVQALTTNQKERERISSLAKIFATIGLFSVVVGIIPVTAALGGGVRAWTLFAVGVVVVMILGQLVTLVGVDQRQLIVPERHVRPREVFDAVRKNDQLLWTAISMVLFQTGYVTTTTFGPYFFKYIYGDAAMYTPFGAILGVGMVLGFLLFPLARRRFSRRQLYTGSMAVIVAGYLIFFFAPMNMIVLSVCGLMLFIGDSFIVILMIGFITDCVDYGQWKLGVRSGAVTFAVQPFINKVGGALSTAIVGITLIFTGVNGASGPADLSPGGVWGVKLMMLQFPAVLIVISYLIYRRKFVIDERLHAQIVSELRDRGQLQEQG